MTKKWIELNDLFNGQYSVSKIIRFKTSMLRSDLCDYSDVYVFVKSRIAVERSNDANKRNEDQDHGYQKFVADSKTMEKILILLCRYMIVRV